MTFVATSTKRISCTMLYMSLHHDCYIPASVIHGIHTFPFILEDPDHIPVAAYKMAALVEQARILEPALLHYPARSGIADEMVSPDMLKALHVETVVEHQPQGFCAYALVPERLPQPIAHFTVVRPDTDVAGLLRIVADAAYGFSCLPEDNGPGRVIAEKGSDDL